MIALKNQISMSNRIADAIPNMIFQFVGNFLNIRTTGLLGKTLNMIGAKILAKNSLIEKPISTSVSQRGIIQSYAFSDSQSRSKFQNFLIQHANFRIQI